MITIYGIRNCDTVKKSLQWFDERRLPYQFHDFKKQGLDAAVLQDWLERLGWEGLVNRRGTTWRKLALTESHMTKSAAPLIMANLSLIRRPVIQWEDRLTLGFTPEEWALTATKVAELSDKTGGFDDI